MLNVRGHYKQAMAIASTDNRAAGKLHTISETKVGETDKDYTTFKMCDAKEVARKCVMVKTRIERSHSLSRRIHARETFRRQTTNGYFIRYIS